MINIKTKDLTLKIIELIYQINKKQEFNELVDYVNTMKDIYQEINS